MRVDQDLLADYLGGALAGTADHARVAELIATDPDWAAAAAALSTALDAVAADLATLPTPAMPPQVAARLDAALDAAARQSEQDLDPPSRSSPLPSESSAPGDSSVPGGSAIVPAPRSKPGAGRPVSDRPAGRPARRARRRRLTRWGGGVAAAAAVLGFGWLGYPALIDAVGGVGDDGGMLQGAGEVSASDQPPPAPPAEGPGGAPAEGPDGAGPPLLATGTDYQPTQLPGPPLPEIRADQMEGWSEGPNGPSPMSGPQVTVEAAVPLPLQRLWTEPAVRAACLSAVMDTVPAGPAVVQVVDFARFQGEPAVVIWLTGAAGEPVVVVSGPDCGSPGAGADERYRTSPD